MSNETLDVKKEVALDARTNIKESFARVELLTRQLIEALRPADAPHVVYSMPIRNSKELVGDIPVLTLTGSEAWEKALHAFELYYRLEDQHPMASYRLPGLIYVSNMAEIKPLVDELNLAKDALKKTVTSVPSGQRHRVTYETMPGVILLQVYRKIMVFDQEARRFVFSWGKRTSGSKKVTVAEVLQRINQDIKSKIEDNGELFADISMAQLNGEKAMIEALDPREELRYYRIISPHPRLMGFDKHGSKEAMFTYHANLPVITQHDHQAKVRALPDCLTGSNQSTQRKDHKSKTLLIPRLYLYALTEQ